jgi:hypothetical protein
MKPLYTAYAKSINGTTFYFVKSFRTFPELKNIPPLLEAYGMHTRFDKACEIAQIFDRETQLHLLHKIDNGAGARVIPINTGKAEIYNLNRRHTIFPSLLKLLRIG